MLKKYVCLTAFWLVSTAVLGQINCPDFKIRGNKSPRSNRFTTAIKFQLDGIVQYQGFSPRFPRHFRLYPALSMGLEQSISQKLSISVIHGWTFSANSYNSRTLAGDVRYYVDQCFQDKWFSTRLTWAERGDGDLRAGIQPFVSVHYGKTARLKHIFTHYEMGIGYGQNSVLVFSLGVATGLKL